MAPVAAAHPEHAPVPTHTGMAGFLDLVERLGNRVPHPVVIFVAW